MTTPGVPGDKLFPPMNAPGPGQPVPGVQPGASSAVVLAQFVIIFGDTGGMFVYAGTPALGNPPVYSVSNATTDPYGNTVEPGIWAGPPGGTQVGMQSNGGFGELFFLNGTAYNGDALMASSSSAGGITLEIFSAKDTANPGPTSDRVGIFLEDNLTGGGSARIQQWYFDTAGSARQLAFGDFTGLTVAAGSVTAVDPSTGTSAGNPFAPETWHPVTLDAGWTAGSPAPQYRKTAGGNVQFTGNASHANFTVGTNVNGSSPLPAAYRPANAHYWRNNDQFRAGLQLLSSGIITAFPAAAGNTQIDLDGVVALL